MWDSHPVSELIVEFSEIISKGKCQFFLKYKNDIPIGFAQCQLRYNYVEGTKTTSVGYLEGIVYKKYIDKRIAYNADIGDVFDEIISRL